MAVTFDNIEFHFDKNLDDIEKNRAKDVIKNALEDGAIECEECDHAKAFVYVDDELHVNGRVNISCDCDNIEREFHFQYHVANGLS